jgi:hypothetical protein
MVLMPILPRRTGPDPDPDLDLYPGSGLDPGTGLDPDLYPGSGLDLDPGLNPADVVAAPAPRPRPGVPGPGPRLTGTTGTTCLRAVLARTGDAQAAEDLVAEQAGPGTR